MLHQDTIQALENFRRRRAAVLTRRAVLAGLAFLFVALTALALLDRARLLPDTLRPWLSLAAYAGAIGVAWRFGLRHVFVPAAPLETARLLETAVPALREQLVPALELARVQPDRQPIGDSPEFRAFLQESVAKEVRAIRWPETLPADALTPWWRRLSGIGVLAAVLLFIPSLHFSGFIARAALPFASLERPSTVLIHFLSPDQPTFKVPVLSDYLIAAEILNLDSASEPQLEWVATGGSMIRQPLTRTWGDRFESKVLIAETSLKYRIRAGDALTTWRTLAAIPRPTAIHFVKTIYPPAYLDSPELTLEEDHGHLTGLQGSQVEMTITTDQALKLATVHLNPEMGDVPPLSPVEFTTPNTFVTRFELTEGMHSWQAELVAEATGFTNPIAQPWRIEVVIDQPPTVVFTNTNALLYRLPDATVQLTGLARDDLGLKYVRLAHSVNGSNTQHIEIPIDAPTEAMLDHLFPLAMLNVRDGDTVSFQWQATDLKGQEVQSASLQVIIQEQTVPSRLRAWSAATQRIARTAKTLQSHTDDLAKYLQKRHRAEHHASEDFQATTQSALDDLRQTSDELASLLQDAARLPDSALAAEENRLLSAQVSQFRHAALPEIERQIQDTKVSLDQVRAAASAAKQATDALLTSSETFAAAAAAEVTAINSEQQLRSQSALTGQALEANRDPSQQNPWLEKQRGAVASSGQLIEDLKNLSETTRDASHQNLAKEAAANLQEAGEDLLVITDHAPRPQTPEQIYSAADQLRSRLQRTNEQTRKLADHYAQKATTLRQQLGRKDTPALVALEEAKTRLEKNAPASESLAKSAKLFQDQADQAAQEVERPNPAAALDASRLSRAIEQIDRSLEASSPESDIHREAASVAGQLEKASRTLESDAALQRAAQILNDLAVQSLNEESDPMESRERSANALAAAEALERMANSKPATPSIAAAADLARQSAKIARSSSREFKKHNNETTSAELARNAAAQARAAADQLVPDTLAARELIESLTPKLSELMNQLAQDLQSDHEATQTTADQAAANAPVEDVAEDVRDLLPQTATTADRLASLQSALRQEANQADLRSADERDLSRAADVAIEQIRQTTPQVTEQLKQAAHATANPAQQQNLQAAANTQKQSAETLQQLADHFAQAEQGQPIDAQELAALQKTEQELGVQEALDQAYDRAAELARLEELAQQDPSAALQALERELKTNAPMQKALANLGSETAEAAAAQLDRQADQPASLGSAAAEASHEILRVARHEERLGQEEAAAALAAAGQQIAEAAAAPPGTHTPETSRNVKDLAQAAAQTAAASNATIPSPPTISPFDGIQAAALAAALDQLDQKVYPQPGNSQAAADPNAQGQSPPPPGSQADSAGQKLAEASQSQQQSMADSRNQGKVPGSENQPPSPSPSQQPGEQDNSGQSTDGGNFQLTMKDGELGPDVRVVPGDWGRLPSRTAEQLSEASRQEAPEEFRAAIEAYYKAIATRARQN